MNFSIHAPNGANKVNIFKTYSHKKTCPDSCALKNNGCYAENFHVNLHWSKITDGQRGIDWQSLIDQISILPARTLWRHNIAGDLIPLATDGERIDGDKLAQLTTASAKRNKRGFTYTHYPLSAANVSELRQANKRGFTVNASTNNTAEAIAAYKTHKLPTVTVLPTDAPNVETIDGVKIVACPADKSKRVNCGNCAANMCANPNRDFIIGFRAHGTKKKSADIIARAA